MLGKALGVCVCVWMYVCGCLGVCDLSVRDVKVYNI